MTEVKLIHQIAHNRPELIQLLKNRFCIKGVKVIKRNFLKYEGVNFVYTYQVKIIIMNTFPKCSFCGEPIKSAKPALYNGKKACQYCFRLKTKGYFK